MDFTGFIMMIKYTHKQQILLGLRQLRGKIVCLVKEKNDKNTKTLENNPVLYNIQSIWPALNYYLDINYSLRIISSSDKADIPIIILKG